MATTSKFFYALLLVILVVGLAGCELSRDDSTFSDPGPVSDVPPTLAPLGAETDMIAETTSDMDVISVETTTETAAVGVAPADGVTESMAEPASEEVTVEGMNSDAVAEAAASADQVPTAEEAAVEEAASEGSIVVDASESLPMGGPVAADPPTSAADGYSGVPSYGGQAYQVRPGDTLFSIAQRYGTSVDAIVYANGLTSEVINIGQMLSIPAGSSGGHNNPQYDQPTYGQPNTQQPYSQQQPPFQQRYVPSPGDAFHRVSPGETLYQVALRYGSTVEVIASANGLSDPYILQIGQQLVIPAGRQQYGNAPSYGQQQPYGYDQQQPYGYDQQQPYGYDQQQPYGYDQQQPYGYDQQQPYGYDQQQPYGYDQQQPYGYDQQQPYGYDQQQPYGYDQQQPYGYDQQQPSYGYDQQQPSYGYDQQQPYGYDQQQPYGYDQQQPYGYDQQQPYGYDQQQPGGYFPQDGGYGAPNNGATHTVAPGETLYSIAMRYGTSAEALATGNGVYDPNQIYVGQVLFLP